MMQQNEVQILNKYNYKQHVHKDIRFRVPKGHIDVCFNYLYVLQFSLQTKKTETRQTVILFPL
jgi:hypothetical protein